MEAQELTGYYTLRSFLNDPSPVDDFNKVKFVEAEIFLIVQADGTVIGTFSIPPNHAALEKKFMNIDGNVKNLSSPLALEFTAKGRPNTATADLLHEYSCSVTRTWEKGIGQRLCLTGTVLSLSENGSKGKYAKPGATASFVAVKRDFIEPKDIPGVAIIPSALSMLASRSHRLKHAVWHTIRGIWNEPWIDEGSKTKIRQLGWGLDRPPFTREGALDLSNGAGEDFLFMHRKMISMVRHEYTSQKVPYIESWKTLPRPNAQQFSYSEQQDPADPSRKIYRLNIMDSGYMVPPAQPTDLDSLKFLKSPDYFRLVMGQLEGQFTRQRHLSGLSLGALGNLLEFTIHNQMHMRWSGISRDPKSSEPATRGDFDFDEKWDDPKYDYLGDVYSSHVNPVFWRLHGWVDDRIEDWFNAHEASKQGEIERYEYQGIGWFKPGKWVQVSKPFYWPEDHHHHLSDQEEIETMLKVMEIIKLASETETAKDSISLRHPAFGITSFMWAIDLN